MNKKPAVANGIATEYDFDDLGHNQANRLSFNRAKTQLFSSHRRTRALSVGHLQNPLSVCDHQLPCQNEMSFSRCTGRTKLKEFAA
jgi:hypothetical protein